MARSPEPATAPGAVAPEAVMGSASQTSAAVATGACEANALSWSAPAAVATGAGRTSAPASASPVSGNGETGVAAARGTTPKLLPSGEAKLQISTGTDMEGARVTEAEVAWGPDTCFVDGASARAPAVASHNAWRRRDAHAAAILVASEPPAACNLCVPWS